MSVSRRKLLAATGAGVAAAAIDAGGLVSVARAVGAAAPTTTAALASASAVPPVTTWDQTVQRASYATGTGYQKLVQGPGEPHVMRTELWPYQPHVTKYIAAFAQMTDLHIVDDQSPARLEFMDQFADQGAPHFGSYPTDSAWRPHEMLSTQVVEAMCQAIKGIGKGPRTKLPLKFTIVTGDAIDNCQHNENRWYIDLLDGGKTIVPDSGLIGLDQSYASGYLNQSGDFGPGTHFYYPSLNPTTIATNRFTGTSATVRYGFPYIPGLVSSTTEALGAVRRPFISTGLGMPWYSAYGNHDGMWQGNEPIDNALIDVKGLATGSGKVVDTLDPLPDNYSDLGTWAKLNAAWKLKKFPVAPDPQRRLLSRKAFIEDHFNTSGLPVGHGFQGVGIDKAYYAIPSGPGELIQYITLDSTNTNTDGFGSGGASGSIDDTQFQWLKSLLLANSSRYVNESNQIVTQSGVTNKMFVLFCHHTLDTMDNLDDGIFGGNRHTGDELKALLLRFPNVILMVNGHTHANKITPHRAPSASPIECGFWEVSTASHIDWPIQSRIIEIAAGHRSTAGDGTVSIFTTMVDIAAPLAYGGDLSSPVKLASLARELATNDPQEVGRGITHRMGVAADRNAQLLVAAPFPLFAPYELGSPIAVARNDDGRLELFGTDADGNLYQNSQSTVSGNLTPTWQKLNSGGWQSVAAKTNNDGRVELFAIDNLDTIRFVSQTSPGSSTYTRPGLGFANSSFTSVAALRDSWGGLEVFATIDGGAIYHNWQQSVGSPDTWVGWRPLGGGATQLAAEIDSNGLAMLVGIDEDGKVFQRRKLVPGGQTEAEWGPAFALDGNLDSIAITRNLNGTLVIFGTNSDRQIFQRFETAAGSGVFGPWSQIPGRMSHIAAERNGAGRIELFAVDHFGGVFHAKQTATSGKNWTAWTSVNFTLRTDSSFVA